MEGSMIGTKEEIINQLYSAIEQLTYENMKLRENAEERPPEKVYAFYKIDPFYYKEQLEDIILFCNEKDAEDMKLSFKNESDFYEVKELEITR